MATSYSVQTEQFAGPLDLLLALIERRKLSINDIALREVTNDFVAYVESHPEYPVDVAAQFVLIGSALVLIKSRSLLPVLELSTEEEEAMTDLEQRLKAYQHYRSLARTVIRTYLQAPLFERTIAFNDTPVFTPSSVSAEGMHALVVDLLARAPSKQPQLSEATVKKVISLEEMVNRLGDAIRKGFRASFHDVSGFGKEERVHVVVSFLALLELMKRGVVRVEQERAFEDITLEHDSVDVPKYG